MPLRQTLQWMLILLATIVIVGGGGVIWLWGQSDAILKTQITQQLDKLAPNLPVKFQKASLETDGRIRLTDIELQATNGGPTLLRLPETVIFPDRELLVQHRQLSVFKVVINRPQVTLEQAADGGWSFDGLKLPKPAGIAWPEVELLDGEILFRAHRDAVLPIELRLTNLDANLKPTAKGQCEIQGHGDLDPVGPVEIKGQLDTTTGRWKVQVVARRIPAGDQLIGVASDLSSSVKSQVRAFTQTVREKTHNPALQSLGTQPSDRESEIKTTALEGADPGAGGTPSLIPRIGLRADLALKCAVACAGFGEPINYAVDLKIDNGEVTDLFPIPLYEVSGHVLLTREHVLIENLKAVNGDSQLTINGELPLNGSPVPPSLQLHAANLPVDRRIRELTPGLTKLYDLLQPEGRFDVDLAYAPGQAPPVVLREFRVRDGSLLHDLFRYRAQSINGTIVQQGDSFVFDMTGLASGHEVKLTGFMRHPGPEMETDLRVQTTQGLPIDDTLIAAFETPKLEKIAATLRELQIRGEGDVDVSFRKSPKTGPKILTFLKAKVRNSELSFKKFPLPLTQVSGLIENNPLAGNQWTFKQLQGQRGETSVTGFGSFVTQAEIGQLTLQLDALDVPLDATLKTACLTANPKLQSIWDQLNPSAGNLEFQKIKIQWSPKHPPVVTLPVIKVQGAALQLASVPYPLDRVSGALSWGNNVAEIQHVEGWHGSTFIEISGTAGKPAPFFEISPAAGIDWRLHLPELSLRKIIADDELKESLPNSIRAAVKQLDPHGPFDLDVALDLKQYRAPDPVVTASFKLDAALRENDLKTGVTLHNATGRVTLINGTWDGQLMTAEGYAELDSVRVYDLPLTQLQGPFSFVGNRITAGQPPVGSPQPYSATNPYAKQQIVASLYGGKVTLNAEAVVDQADAQGTKYDAEIHLHDAELEQWARETGSRERLQGKCYGQVSFHGQGASPLGVEGVGWVNISPAQLYELPVLVKVFALPNFRSSDDKAFGYAYADFNIGQGKFNFTKIELIGDAVRLIGRGNADFANEQEHPIDFDFYTVARNRLPLAQLLGNKWVWIRVDGTTQEHKAVIQARVPILDEAFRGLMQNLESGQLPAPPIPTSAAAPKPQRR